MPFGFYLLVSDAYPDGCFVLGRKAQSFQIRRVLHLRVESALHDEQFVEKMVALGIKLNLNKT